MSTSPRKPSGHARRSKLDRHIANALAADARPVAAVVGLDPATAGELGLCVWHVSLDHPYAVYHGRAFDSATTMWLGSTVARAVEPGTRVLLAAEATAYGMRVARALGRCVGYVEGLLVDINAMAPGTLLEVGASTWRNDAGIYRIRGRLNLKAAACKLANEYSDSPTGYTHDEAEALLLARSVVNRVRKAAEGGRDA